jgi:soluble lytic murein transglycosylase
LKIFFFILFLSLGLISREISLQEINSYPKSIAKDFYIWQYLQQPWVTKEDAEKAFKQVSRINSKIKQAFRSRGGVQQFKIKKCKILSINAILKSEDLNCIKENLTPKRVSLLDGDDLAKLIKKFKKVDKNLTLLLMAIYYSQDIEKTLYANPEIYLDIFLKGGSKLQKSQKINKYLSDTFLQKLVKYRWKFKKFIATILTSNGNKFEPLKQALLQLKPDLACVY